MAGPPVYEMLWDCKFCGAKKLLGLTHRHCPNCGAQQDANARYFPPDSERIAVQDHEYVGADIVCRYCGSATSKRAHCCGNCGAPLAEGQGVAQRADQIAAPQGAPAPRKKRSPLVWIVPLLVAVLLACGGLGAALFWKKQGAFKVTGNQWKRSITIETFTPVGDSAWCDALPAGATDVKRHKEERSKKQVPDGQNCTARKVDNGDGTFHEKQDCTAKFKEEPVYDDKCDFKVTRWHTERVDTAQGTTAANVNWPASVVARPGTCAGCEREGARTETYTVVFQDAKAEEYRCDFPQAKWTGFAPGSSWKGEIRRVVGTLDCDSLAKP